MVKTKKILYVAVEARATGVLRREDFWGPLLFLWSMGKALRGSFLAPGLAHRQSKWQWSLESGTENYYSTWVPRYRYNCCCSGAGGWGATMCRSPVEPGSLSLGFATWLGREGEEGEIHQHHSIWMTGCGGCLSPGYISVDHEPRMVGQSPNFSPNCVQL